MSADKDKIVFLVVDDDSQVREILKGYLESFGFKNIVDAKDGRTALKIIQNHQQKIDFIVSDWEMPHVDGLTLLRAVRKDSVREDVKFIMVTSQGSRERMKITKAAKSRVDAYVVKPFRASVLLQKINTLMNGEIDQSVKEFEESIYREVPSNEQIEQERQLALGRVILDKEVKGSGVLKTIKNPTNKLGAVKNIDVDNPPETYDLSAMNEQLIVKLAKAYNKVKWFPKVIRLCTDAHFLFPANADILYELAYAYHLQGNSGEALKNLGKLTKVAPYHIEGQTLISEIRGKKVA